MIELLILHELSEKILTMYGISKEIRKDFSVLTTPSYGTIKPALRRLEVGSYVKIRKSMTSGGRPSTYYSITEAGVQELKRLLMAPPLDNPIQFLTMARVKIACAGILGSKEQKELFNSLKLKCEEILLDSNNLLESKDLSFYSKMIFNNLICEYKNFISLLEGLYRAGDN